MSSTTKLLRELIAIPSVNPAFLPDNDSCAGEQRVAEFLMATAARAGLDVALRPVFKERPNLLAKLSPRGAPKMRVLLAPHLDTVGGDLDTIFTPRVRNDRLYGRGACDTKGSVAAMMDALMTLASAGRQPRDVEIIFAGLADEENGQEGSRALVASGLDADLAIVGEPTGLRVVTAHKGDLWLQLETRGKAAHGSKPELGRNAVHEMARIVEVFETTYAAMLRRRSHRILGHPTVNVGTIAGGSQPNIVPDRCRISIDRRTIPGETETKVRREIRGLLQRHRLSATLLNIRDAPCPPLETDSKLPLVAQFRRAAGERNLVGVDYFCDAAVLADGGIPSVVFGPGNIAQAHTADEWVSIRQLEASTRLLYRFLSSLP